MTWTWMEWMVGRKNPAAFFLCQERRQAGRLTDQTRRLDGWAIWPIIATTATVVYQREFISKGRGMMGRRTQSSQEGVSKRVGELLKLI